MQRKFKNFNPQSGTSTRNTRTSRKQKTCQQTNEQKPNWILPQQKNTTINKTPNQWANLQRCKHSFVYVQVTFGNIFSFFRAVKIVTSIFWRNLKRRGWLFHCILLYSNFKNNTYGVEIKMSFSKQIWKFVTNRNTKEVTLASNELDLIIIFLWLFEFF